MYVILIASLSLHLDLIAFPYPFCRLLQHPLYYLFYQCLQIFYRHHYLIMYLPHTMPSSL